MPDVVEINSSALTLQKQEALKCLYPDFFYIFRVRDR